jgi:PAS domain S-box-containing protein
MNGNAPSLPSKAESRRKDLLRAISQWFALAVILVGGAALAGWAFDITTLKSVLPGVVSMKANTAVGLILTGAALGLLGMAPTRPWALRHSRVCAGGAVLLGLLTLAEVILGWNLHIDQLLFTEPAGTVGTLSPGRMAPSAALDFILLGGALLLAGFRLSVIAAQLLALLAGSVAGLTSLGYFFGITVLTGLAPYTQMAIHTALAFIILSAGLLFARPDAGLMAVVTRGAANGRKSSRPGAGGSDSGQSGSSSPEAEVTGKRAFEIGLLVFTAALAMVITLLGFLHFESRRAELQQSSFLELAAVADLKVVQITRWRQERLANARVAMQTPLYAHNVAAFLADPTSKAPRAAVLGWLKALQRNYGYEEIALFDAQGTVLLAVPPTADAFDPQLRALLKIAPQAGDVLISDLHRGGTGEIHIDMIAPLRDAPTPSPESRAGEAQNPSATTGAVVFRIDPSKSLYPLIQSWPMPSETAETLLLRREGDELVYLNELRHRSGTALILRRSINDTQLPAAKAARGTTGAFEGTDYRGVKVLAFTRAIPDSPWFIVAKVDLAEIRAPLRQEAWTVGLVVSILLLSAGLGVGLFWRQATAKNVYRELVAEREISRLSRLYAALSQVNQTVVRANTREELLGAVCRVMADYGRLRLVWIGEHDPANSILKPVAWAGDDQGFLTGLTVYTDERVEGRGPSGTAIREGRGQTYNDFAADPRLAPWRERLAAYRFRSGGAFPIRVRGRMWGSLTVYSPEVGFFRGKEIALLEEAASDISFALDRLEDLADRKRAEDLLKSEQALFSALVSTVPDNIYFKDRNSRFVRINDIMAQRFGLRDPGAAVGRTDADFFTGEHSRQAYEDEQRLMKTGKALVGVEEKETWPDGRVTWVSTTKVPLRDSSGNITGMVGISRDVTAHRRAEEAMRVLSSRQEAILAAVPDIIMEVDVRKVCTWSNPAGFAFYGIDLIGKEVDFFVADGQATSDSVRPLFAGGRDKVYVMSWQRRQDGEKRLLAWWCQALKDGSGNIVGALSSGRDITEIKQAEEALRESEERFRATFEQAAVGIAQAGLDGRFMRVNQRFCRIVGYTTEELCAITFQAITYPDDLETDLDYVRQVLAGEIQTYSMEKRYLRKDHSPVWVNLTVGLVRDPVGAPKYFVSVIEDITERKRVEAAVRQAEEKYRAIFENAIEGIFQTTAEGTFLAVNPAVARILGYASPEELVRERHDIAQQGYVDPRARDEFKRRIDADGAVNGFEYEAWRKDGSKVWVSENARVVRDPAGRVLHYEGAMEDITGRKQAQAALRESEEQLRAMFDLASVGIAQAEPQTGRWLRVNRKMCEITGYSAEELLRMRISEITHPNDRQPDQEAFQRVVRGEQPDYHMEKRYLRKDGSLAWVNVNMTIIHGAGGQPLRSVAMIEDITERKAAEKALRESQALHRSLVTHSPAGVFRKDREGRYVFVNDLFCHLKDLSADEILGKTPRELAELESAKEAAGLRKAAPRQRTLVTHGTEHHELIMRTGQTIEVEETYPQPDGSVEYFQVVKSPVFSPDGQVIGSQGIQFDITQRRQAEAEIRQLNAHLEQRVRERTTELEAANLELEAFSYSVSHDLRAPLRAIDGFARILVDEHASSLSVEGARVLNVVMMESERMGRLIDDLLAFSRVSRQSLQPLEIDLAALAGEIFREQAAQVPGRKIQLQVVAVPRAMADPALLRQVLVNLIGNAIKYTRAKELARIEVGGSVRASENVYYVKDNGAGFDPSYMDKLFGVFQRLHSEAEFEGTGVGLALVKRIINRHGGRVWAEGQVDQGATFFFTLPSSRS